MARWNKKSKGHSKDLGYYSGETHAYAMGGKTLYQRYNATLGCFEDVPDPRKGIGTPSQLGTPPNKCRMKVMVKPFINEAGEVIARPALEPAPQQQLVERYEEVVEENGQVVVHVPDSAAGPDGVIRLLQVTNEDGTVHYISTDQTDLDDYTVEDAMEMILTEGEPGEHVDTGAEQHVVIQAVTDQGPAEAEAGAEAEAEADAEAEAEAEAEPDAPPSGPCYVCGEDGPADQLASLMSARSRHTDSPLAELLADAVQRELTVANTDGVCPVCLTLMNQCDRPDALSTTATRHIRNIMNWRRRQAAKRKPGRPRIKTAPSEVGPWIGSGAVDDPEDWTLALDARHDARHFYKLEELTDLRVPSDTKRSARIAIRRNASVAAATHPSIRPRVLIDPEMQAQYRADVSRPTRRYVHRLSPGKAKGRRGRPKLPNPPENLPANGLTQVDSEPTEEISELVIISGSDDCNTQTEKYTIISTPEEPPLDARGVQELDVVITTDAAEPDVDRTDASDADETRPDDTDTEADEPETEPEPEPERQADPDCTCIMCAELTDEEQRVLRMDPEFGVTYVCNICNKETVGYGRATRHDRSCRRRMLNHNRRPLVHLCSTCNCTFRSARLRDEHYVESGHEKRSPCPVCHRWFHPDFLRIHLNSHSGAFFCKVCNTHFSSKATLRGHMYRHSGLKPHKCDQCACAFRTPSSLFMHRRYHHTDERPYVCNFCPKGFAARSTLRIHLRQHTGERPFVCKLCSKTYTRKSSLTQHLRSHTQERRHACMTCGKRFDNKTYLTVHTNRHLGVRAHRCERCGRGFYSRPNLLKHMQVICFKSEYKRGELPARPRRPPHSRRPQALADHVAREQLTEDGVKMMGQDSVQVLDDGVRMEDEDAKGMEDARLQVVEDDVQVMTEDDVHVMTEDGMQVMDGDGVQVMDGDVQVMEDVVQDGVQITDDVQTTEVILAIESMPEGEQLLVSALDH